MPRSGLNNLTFSPPTTCSASPYLCIWGLVSVLPSLTFSPASLCWLSFPSFQFTLDPATPPHSYFVCQTLFGLLLLCQVLSPPNRVPALMEEAPWWRGGLARMIGVICVWNEACWLLRSSNIRASLREGIPIGQRGPALPAQACCRVEAWSPAV